MSEEQQNLSLEQQQDEGSFAAGYNKVRGIEPPTEEPAAVEQPAPIAATEEQPAEVHHDQETPLFEGLTPSQLKAKLDEIDQLRQENRKAFGKVGELNSRLQQFQERFDDFQKQPASQRTPAKFAKLAEHFPEIAELMEADLQEVSGTTTGKTQEQPVDVDKRINELFDERVGKVRDESQIELLTMKHPDWEEIKWSDDFEKWTETLQKDEFKVLMNSKRASDISKFLDTFKDWRKQESERQAAEKQKQDRRQRIEAAAAPASAAAPPNSEPSASERFRAGYERIRKANQL